MNTTAVVSFLESQIAYKKESLIEQADSLIRRLESVKRVLDKQGCEDGGLNDLGELQSRATMFEASVGYLCGLTTAWSALKVRDGDK
jgi:hypothetical protein